MVGLFSPSSSVGSASTVLAVLCFFVASMSVAFYVQA